MNREILFRGALANNGGSRATSGEWVYGNLIEIQDEYETEYAILEKTAEHRYGGEYGDDGWHKVIPETVGQYTGLTDKNGNKIFEGDVIKVVTEDTHEERFIEVCVGEFTDDGSGDLFIGAYLKYDGFTVSAGQIKESGSNRVEIVGNSYDNPELLTDKT